MDLIPLIFCALEESFAKLYEKGYDTVITTVAQRQKIPCSYPHQHSHLYNSQLVMKSLGACGCSAFSQVQTFYP